VNCVGESRLKYDEKTVGGDKKKKSQREEKGEGGDLKPSTNDKKNLGACGMGKAICPDAGPLKVPKGQKKQNPDPRTRADG